MLKLTYSKLMYRHNEKTVDTLTCLMTEDSRYANMPDDSPAWPHCAALRAYRCIILFVQPLQQTAETELTLIVLMWRIGWAHNNARK